MRKSHAGKSPIRRGFWKGVDEFLTGMALFAIPARASDSDLDFGKGPEAQGRCLKRILENAACLEQALQGGRGRSVLEMLVLLPLIFASCIVAFATRDLWLTGVSAAPALAVCFVLVCREAPEMPESKVKIGKRPQALLEACKVSRMLGFLAFLGLSGAALAVALKTESPSLAAAFLSPLAFAIAWSFVAKR